MTKPGKMHCFTCLNNRRTGKHTTKPRALGLLGHSDFICMGLLGLQGAKNRELQNENFLPIPGLELTTQYSQV